jgi:bloom syndrome protein
MQVRSSPRKSRAKEAAVKKSKKQRVEIPSTNVSSPIRAPKQKIRQYTYNKDDGEEDDAFDAPHHPTRKQRARAYEADNLIANDDDIDGDFPPVRVARSTKNVKPKALGHPITTDERVDELNDDQQCTFIDFMTGARKLRKEIMTEKGHREPIFNDTVLQEMGLELPTDLDEMQVIPGIRPEMVDRYGKRFLPLINNSRELYRGNVPGRRHLPVRQYALHQVGNAEHDEDEILDPNHQNIIDLCSDDEAALIAEDLESNYFDSDDDDDGDDDDGEMHISHHFTQHVDPEVVAFNNRMTQLGPTVPKTAKTARTLTTQGGSRDSTVKKGRLPRRNGSGSFGKSYAGVRKRATKGTTSRASGGTGAAKKAVGSSRKGGGSTAPWSSIMAMPT